MGRHQPVSPVAVSPDTPSAHNLKGRVGMSPRDPPLDLAAVRGAAGVPFSASKQVLLASPRAFSDAVADLRRWSRADGLLASPKGDAVVRVDLGWFDPEVLAAV